ncbi:MAG: ycfQ2 [Labilithrix sp.]|nr:ycfQ2 [Labilithrix sp.]
MGRPRTFDKADALMRFRDEFWERGYAATSLDDLMKATGLGKGSLYLAFGDKHQLFLEVLDGYIERGIAGVRKALAGDAPAIERLRAFFRSGPKAGGRGCLLMKSTMELASSDPQVEERARGNYRAMESALADVVREAVAEGDLSEDTDAERLARLLVAVGQGMLFLARTGLTDAELDAIGEDATTRLLVKGNPRAQKPRRKRSPPSRPSR